MSKIEFPNELKDLLEGSAYKAGIEALAVQVGEIVSDNKLPFFPDYTDHGADHINSVLKSEVELVPDEVWQESTKDSKRRLLCDADAAVIIGATLLHDIALHLHPAGFLELISKGSRFQPLPWFNQGSEDYAADLPWFELWDQFAREARRFSDRALANIIGLDSVRSDWKFTSLPEEPGRWERNHFRIVGEFLRRHHARLAHEIAIYGFPGLKEGGGEHQFPAMGQEAGHKLRPLADLIGLTARSHGISLRVCLAYLEAEYQGVPRPMRTAVLYPMALLRVADYLQIDRQRAPPVLLQLKDPQSPTSVQEWEKHRAVEQVGPAKDPRGKMVKVSKDIGLETYLQLKDLFAGIQNEIDHSTTVLDEAYGTLSGLGLNQLGLATRRVYSNLHSPVFRNRLPYVPEKTGFSADPNLLSLLVKPLYGNEPGVGVRELMQNAVDAVRELEVWCETRGKDKNSLDLPRQDADVLIEYIQREDESWFLRIQDKGIGMTADTIQNFFLRAGASFRQSPAWAKDFLEDDGSSRVVRAGRFGVGAFAIFLLGPSFHVWTRHASSKGPSGYEFVASVGSERVEILYSKRLLVGTKVEVELTPEAASRLTLSSNLGRLRSQVDWYCWDWPRVVQRVIKRDGEGKISQEFIASESQGIENAEWSGFEVAGLGRIQWTFGGWASLACNGIRISAPQSAPDNSKEDWWPNEIELKPPCLSVSDPGAKLALTVQRYQLETRELPFIKALQRDVLLSFIAHALVCGPQRREEAIGLGAKHPLYSVVAYEYVRHLDFRMENSLANGRFRWCTGIGNFVPTDPWLYSLLSTKGCVVAGVIGSALGDFAGPAHEKLVGMLGMSEAAVITWFHFDRRLVVGPATVGGLRRVFAFLSDFSSQGISALGAVPEYGRLLASVAPGTDLNTPKASVTMDREGWQTIPASRSHRPRILVGERDGVGCEDLVRLLDGLDEILVEAEDGKPKMRHPDLVFVAEVRSKAARSKPQSPIAKIWNECLGPTAIPFEPIERRELIDRGRQHAELRRHIEAWEEMKRAGSKWANDRTY